MRRTEQEITDPKAVEELLKRGQVCHVAMCDGDKPYVVPLCYGYADGAIYIHCAREGRKLEVLRKNSNVCFEITIDGAVTKGDAACDWAFAYKSVIGFGRAELIEDANRKREALDVIMRQFSGPAGPYSEGSLARTLIIKVEIASMTGKRSR
jgi:nitroimidazol reductase NimA-like FMN-containing flavoprotein (pyridoxamine 5'-phosphate oxidase superfamily)